METKGKCCENCLWCYDEEDLKDYKDFDEEELPEVGDCIMLMKKFLDGKPFCKSYLVSPKHENIYVIYDDTYLGSGYFVVDEIDGLIQKFIKIYISNNEGLPIYNIRAYEKGSKDNPNLDCRNINFDFSFQNNSELQNSMYKLFQTIGMKPLKTINPSDKGESRILFIANQKYSKIVVSKDIWNGKEVCSDFIDIVIGDNYTCCDYEAINSFYQDLSQIAINSKEDIVNRILKL